MRAAGLYIGWLGYQNLGDDALFQICTERFSHLAWFPAPQSETSIQPGQFASRVTRDWSYLPKALVNEFSSLSRSRKITSRLRMRAHSRAGQFPLLGGGTIINKTNPIFDTYRRLKAGTGKPLPIFGAGVADPHFWSRMPRYTDRRKEWVAATADLPVVGVRGPLSQRLMEEVGARNVVTVGDPMSLWHEQLKPSSRNSALPLRIAINAGHAPFATYEDSDPLNQKLGMLARKLVTFGHEVTFIAVCPEDLLGCKIASGAAGLPHLPIVNLSVHDCREIISGFDAVVAVKLHTAILAAAMNIPFIGIEYRPKCADFFESIQWLRYRVRADRVEIGDLLGMLEEIAAEHQTIRESLCTKMCHQKSTFENYCQAISPLLGVGNVISSGTADDQLSTFADSETAVSARVQDQ